MKVRMLAIFSILALAAWLPISAQQTPAPTDDGKAAAKHECCKGERVNCCHSKGTEAVKTDCCQGKSAKEMPCCTKGEKTDQASVQCCVGMKEGQCSAKDGKSCCGGVKENAEKGCCSKMGTQCPAHANGN